MTAVQRAILCCAICATAVLGASTASAQPTGVDLGDFRLHAGLRLDTGFDTNVFYEDTDEGASSSLRLNVAPSLTMETVRPHSVDLDGSLVTTWEQYLSGEPNIRDQSGLDVNGSLGVRFNADGTVSVRPSDELRRTNDSSADENGDALRLTRNEAALEVGFHPGGSARSERLGFSGALLGHHRIWRYDYQSTSDRNAVGGGGRLVYNFLPKTGVFIAADIDRIVHESPTVFVIGSGEGVGLANVDSTPYRFAAGLSGLLARRFGLLLRAGYGATNYDDGENTGALIAQVELSVYPYRDSEVSLGFRRDFQDALFGNFLTYNRLYLGGELGGTIVTLRADTFLQFSSYSDVGDVELLPGFTAEDLYGTRNREDTVIGANLGLAFHVNRFFDVGTRYEFAGRTSNLEYTFADQPANVVASNSSASYGRHGIYLVLNVHY